MNNPKIYRLNLSQNLNQNALLISRGNYVKWHLATQEAREYERKHYKQLQTQKKANGSHIRAKKHFDDVLCKALLQTVALSKTVLFHSG